MPRKAVSDETRCIADNKHGQRCNGEARPGMDVCEVHDPDRPRGSWCPPPDERRCTATATGGYSRPERKGERCERWATPGTTVCTHHGSKAPQVREAARIRHAEEKLMAKVSALTGVPVDNPLTELAAVAGRARALMEILEDRVSALLDGNVRSDIDDDGEDVKPDLRYPHRSGEQIRGEVQLYERAMDRLGRLLVDIARLNIDERLAKISERQADAVIEAIEAALNAIGVRDSQQRAVAKRAAAAKLRLAS